MERKIIGRKPDALFLNFERISAIPRPSYHEERIAAFLENFAKERGFFAVRDQANNVFVRMPATPGCEKIPPVLLQAHTDMVCEKNAGVEHDFMADGIDLVVDGNFLHANGTTLGADDGIGVAVAMTVLSGEIPRHPVVECLFTSSEEVGLGGVCEFDFSLVTARRMLNIDNNELGLVTCGSCGGLRTDMTLRGKREDDLRPALKLSFSGFAGGHSGENIHEGRANAIRAMGLLLKSLSDLPGFRIASLDGGGKTNAIPRACQAIVGADDPDALADAAEAFAKDYLSGLLPIDRGATFAVESFGDAFCFTKEDTARLLSILTESKTGVIAMSRAKPDFVEWSQNLGVVTTEDDDVAILLSSRSSVESQLDASEEELTALAKKNGAAVKCHNRYTGWEFAPVSDLRDRYLAAYRHALGKEARVNIIHAGLECGEIFGKVPDMDMISISPSVHDLHSPDERLDLDSAEAFWKTIERFFEEL
ncbi:MAG: beta-Ala-His dipeptidase [Clostridia bacterium]|nr:beta-Ala-His dipeptidase [Clostridia bacterium]